MNLLKKIRQANKHKQEVQWPETDNSVFDIDETMSLAGLFQRELEKAGGHACICQGQEHLIEEIRALFGRQEWQAPFAFDTWVKNILSSAGIGFRSSLEDLGQMDVGVGVCDFLVAWTGSIVVSSVLPGGRQFPIFSPELVILARKDQLVLDPDQALVRLHEKYEQAPTQITFITGPSKTADIEKTLIYGMHGPRNVYVFII